MGNNTTHKKENKYQAWGEISVDLSNQSSRSKKRIRAGIRIAKIDPKFSGRLGNRVGKKFTSAPFSFREITSSELIKLTSTYRTIAGGDKLAAKQLNVSLF